MDVKFIKTKKKKTHEYGTSTTIISGEQTKMFFMKSREGEILKLTQLLRYHKAKRQNKTKRH